MKRIVFLNFIFTLFLLPIIAIAAVPSWKIIADKSSLTFTGIQNDVPVTGSFKKFSGEILFDPEQLNASKVKIVVDMNSVATSYEDFTTTLLSDDWFGAKLFPQAIFTADHFTKLSEDHYQAEGMLTIRKKSLPVKINFAAEALKDSQIKVAGNTTLKRSDFGIGQGEWASTDDVKDEVTVNFILVAEKK